MADETTAVLDVPETSDAVLEAPVELETDQEGLPTEETDEENAETKAGVSEEEVQRRISDAVAAQKAEIEAAQNTQRWQASVNWAEAQLKTKALAELDNFTDWFVREYEAKGVAPKINKLVIEKLAGEVANAAAIDQWQAISDNFVSHVRQSYPDWKPPVEMQRQLEQTLALPREHPDRLARMYNLRWEYMRRAIHDSEVPIEAKKLAATEAAKDKKAAGVEKALEGDKARASADRPTAVGGGSPPFQNPDAVLAKAHPLSKEYAVAFKAKYGFDAPTP